MTNTNWKELVQKIRPFVFRLETPNGHGTAFFLTHTGNGSVGIATAYHVIDEAYQWDGPFRLRHHDTGDCNLYMPADRDVKVFPEHDLAFIEIDPRGFKLPGGPLGLGGSSSPLAAGVEIGWCGFPSVASNELCFFHGHISARLEGEKSYLVDGVAINGVSGGPAFVRSGSSYDVDVYGVVTAYLPNRSTGTTLPGVCWVQDVSSYKTDYIPF